MLIEILVVAVIILAGFGLYMGLFRNMGSAPEGLDKAQPSSALHGREPQSTPGRAIHTAESEVCRENLRQLRMLIQMAKSESEDGSAPQSLASMPDAAKISNCPIDKLPYQYNPATGEVKCTHPGHENF